MKWNKVVLPLILAAFFTTVFYMQMQGLNLLLYDIVIAAILVYYQKEALSNRTGKWLLSAFLLSGVAVVWLNSHYAIAMNIFLGVLLSGYLVSGLQHSAFLWLFQGLGNIVSHQSKFVKGLATLRTGVGLPLKTVVIIVPVVLVLLVFLGLYAHSSPWLREGLNSSVGTFFLWMEELMFSVNWAGFWCFVLGLIVANVFIQRAVKKVFEEGNTSFELTRRRIKTKRFIKRNMMALRTELKSGVLLLVSLNLLLALVNFLDIKNIWFGFAFEGQFLKELVHQGTYALIFSVLLSMCVVLFFFRGNLNFYSKNKNLKVLAYLWIGQNMVLLLSVLVRNSIYIHYYALAYKRLGVFMFLLACAIALVLLVSKVRRTRSLSYFFHTNTLSVVAILCAGCFINWDVWIARYNMGHYKTAFLHLDYLSQLSEKAYPEMDLPLTTLREFKQKEPSYFKGFSSSVSRVAYMEPEDFHTKIQEGKKTFLREYPKRSWLEWNLADYQAYNRLAQ